MFGQNNWSWSRLGRILVIALIVTTIISPTAAGSNAAVFSFVGTVPEVRGPVNARKTVLPGRSQFVVNARATNWLTCSAPSTVYVDDDWAGTPLGADPDGIGPATEFGCDSFDTVQGGVAGVAPGGTIRVAAGTYTETGQILIDKNLTIEGVDEQSVFIKPAGDTGTSGDAKGWFLIPSGITFNLTRVTLDGTARKTYQAIRYNGDGRVEQVIFDHIEYEPNGPTYNGGGVRIGAGNVDITNCVFTNMGRYGAMADDGGTGTFSYSSYTGKGAGDWLDYAVDVEYGSHLTVSNNWIWHNRGVSTSDGSTSAAISVWGDPGTQTATSGNQMADNSAGVALAIYAETSDPVVTIGPNDDIRDGGVGIEIQNAGFTGAPSPVLSVTGSTIRTNTTGIAVPTGISTANITVNFNRIAGNGTGISNLGTGVLGAENNWWGCSAGPGFAGCDPAGRSPISSRAPTAPSAGNVAYDPWMVLGVSAAPDPIASGGTSVLTADMTHNSASMRSDLSGRPDVAGLPPMPVAFSATEGTMDPIHGITLAGTANTTFTSTSTASGTACADVDTQHTCTPITIQSPTPTPTPDEYTLSIAAANGVVTRSPDRATYHYGDAVRLTATADVGWTFTHWSGDAAGSTNPLDVVITGDTAITANIAINRLSGRVTYQDSLVPVPYARVTVTGPVPVPTPVFTDLNGDYTMTGFGAGPYTVTVWKEPYPANVNNGVLVNDASMISQYVVHLITMTGTQIAAGRVSGLPNLTSFDASLIAQYIVGIHNPLNNAGVWRFTPASQTVTVLPDTVLNISATCMGDVSGDWVPETLRPAPRTTAVDPANAVMASVPKTAIGQGGTLNVPLRLDNLRGAGVYAYQFDIVYDPAVIEPARVAADVAGTLGSGLSVVSNSPEPGMLKVAVYGALPVTGDGVYVNLRFDAIGNAGKTTPLIIEGFRIGDGTADVITADGSVSIVEAGTATVRGRLVTAYGKPVPAASVLMTSTTGQKLTAIADPDGAFVFSGLTIGETYTITARSKALRFSPAVVSIADNITEIEMIVEP